MDISSSQEIEQVKEKDSRQLIVKLLHVLCKVGITILDEHVELVFHLRIYPETNPDGSAEAQGDSQDKSSLSISGPNHNKKMDFLHIVGDYVNRKGVWGETPLHWSAETGDMELVNIFITAGANVNAEDSYKQTALHLSALNGHKEVVDVLIRAGANVEAEGEYKQTALHLSAWNGHKEVVEALIRAGANVEAEDKFKLTPLHLSARNGYKEVVKALLKVGANVEAEDVNKQTPLHLSAWNGHQEVVKVLLKGAANKDVNNQTPLYISVYSKHKLVAQCLLRAGASVQNRDIWGSTCPDYLRNRRSLRPGREPSKSFELRYLMYTLTNSRKRVHSSTSTKTEHTETISATFTDINSGTFPCEDIRTIHNEESSNNNGQDATSRDMSTLPASETSVRKSAVTLSVPQSLCSPSSPTESQVLDDMDIQEMSSIRQQVENHWAKFSPETTEGCETSCSHDVKAAFQDGRIVIPTTIHITQKKNIKKIKTVNNYYDPGAYFNIHHVDNFAQRSMTVVHPTRKVLVDDDVDDSSSEEEESDNEF